MCAFVFNRRFTNNHTRRSSTAHVRSLMVCGRYVQCAKRVVMRNTRTCDMLRVAHGAMPGMKRVKAEKMKKEQDKRYAQGRLQIPLVKIDERDSQELVTMFQEGVLEDVDDECVSLCD